MNIVNNKRILQKIIIVLILAILINFVMPVKVHADSGDFSDTLLQPVMQLLARLGDIFMGIFHKYMLGTEKMYSTVMLDQESPTIVNEDGYMHVPDEIFTKEENKDKIDLVANLDDYDGKMFLGTGVSFPNILYCPEYMFSNRIAVLDVNFVNPNEYTGNNKDSITSSSLRSTIASWYKGFRNLAIVGLLSVLVYIGIRILIGSTAQDKAKYKERLVDWLVGLCLVFVMHYIMAGIMLVTENVTALLSDSIDTDYIVKIESDDSSINGFKTNLMGYIRFQAQLADLGDAATYTIMYLVLIIFTIMFTITYLKRVLYMAFFTMIAPLVAMTYPLDKMADGKAQGFSMWLKEYLMNAIIQPVHLLLYYTLISSAADLAKDNFLYAIVAVGFLLPAEKFIKKMFRLDKAETTGALGAVAGGALAMQGMKQLASLGKSSSKTSKSNASGGEKEKIRLNGKSDTKDLNAWKNEDGEESGNEANIGTGMGILNDNNQNVENDQNSIDIRNSDEHLDSSNAYSEGVFAGVNKDKNFNQNDLNNNENIKGVSMNLDTSDNKKKKISGINKMKGIGKATWTASRGLRRMAGKAGKAAVRGAGTVAGLTLGAAAAVATGNVSNFGTFAVGGAMAGRAIGNTASNIPGRVTEGAKNTFYGIREGVTNTGQDIKNSYIEGTQGLEAARLSRMETQNKLAKKQFMKDEDEKARYKDLAGKMGINDYKGLMDKAFDYKASGLDDDLIKKGLKMEGRHPNIGHERMINIMQEVNDYSKDYIYDEKKRTALEESLNAQLGENKGQQVMDLMAEAHGVDKYYNNIKAKRMQTKESAEPKKDTNNKGTHK